MKHWTRIISLQTQPGCQEENFDARNQGVLLGAYTLVKETRLFLCFVSSHKGCECGVLEQQCQLSKPSSYTAGSHASRSGSCIWRPNRGIRWCGDRAGRFEYQSGSPQAAEREELQWHICNPKPTNFWERNELYGRGAWPLQRRPVQYQPRRQLARAGSTICEVLLFKLESRRSFLRRQRSRLSSAPFL